MVAYPSTVPVSRKRKPKKKTGKPAQSPRKSQVSNVRGRVDGDLARAMQGLAAYRAEVDEQRAARAAVLAEGLVAELVPLAADMSAEVIVEDVVCSRLGPVLHEADHGPVDHRVSPNQMAEAMVTATEAAVLTALSPAPDAAGAWTAPWRVLSALACVLPKPLDEVVDDAVTRLRGTPAGRVLPRLPKGPVVIGRVLWTRDRYGSRFGVAAPITTAKRPARWYLWDIDACGHETFTVHSGFYPTADAALAAWQAGVGEIASAGGVFAPVDDPSLLAGLLPAEQGFMRTGAESAEQLAEYHRGQRLGDVVKQTIPPRQTQSGSPLDAATAATEFTTWLRARDADQPELPDNLDELAEELADSWNLHHIDAVFATCSPHRVALCVSHLRDYYTEEFVDQLIARLPDWIAWLSERNGTAPELADRCLPYAYGKPHPQLSPDDLRPEYLARVIE